MTDQSHPLSHDKIYVAYLVVMLIGGGMLVTSTPEVISGVHTAPPLESAVLFTVGGTIISIGALISL